MNISCILCKSADTAVSDSIDAKQLSILYKKRAGAEVERFFKQPTIHLYTCGNCGLKFYWPQAIGDGKFYDELLRYSGYYLEEKAEFTEASKLISANDHVLEVGCGEGLFTNFIQCKSYAGLEFSEDAIVKARKKGLNVINQTLEQHAASHPESYDVVCYFQVLEHVEEPGKFIDDSLKCLKRGGKLLVAVPSEDSFIKNVVNFYLNMPPHHASRWTDKALEKVAELFNLEVVKLFHEPLHVVHKKFYIKTAIYKKAIAVLGKKYKPVDRSVTGSLLYGIATILSYPGAAFLAKDLTGQSVFVVYKKK